MFCPLQLGSMHWPHLSVGECGMFVNQLHPLLACEALEASKALLAVAGKQNSCVLNEICRIMLCTALA